ncbi:MAG TPA: MraY family glycosyltransferase, partial [Abditibacteriaceae bacterium]|nr:MraY family glycosyltransferase [Abditibacteriaceae bacterium]
MGALLTSFVIAAVLTPVVINVARAHGLVARPSVERWHTKPTALMGGVAIFGAALVAALLFLPVFTGKLAFIGTGVGALFIFLVGLYDDRRALRPATKLIAQLVTACLFVAIFQNSLDPPTYGWLVPFAILWVVGITNAFNLLDNMDGLAAGVAMLVAFLMAAHAALVGDTNVVIGALIIAGSAGGFLIYNFHPAKVFMGDCGSMFLGFSLACLSLMGESGLLSGNLFTALMMPTLVLATPLFDTTFVSLVRVLHGRSIAQGGRDHTSHRLVLLGLSERRAVFWLYGITLWFGLIALWGASIQNWLGTVAISVLSVIALLVLGL